MKLWSLDQLKSALNARKEIRDWVIRTETLHRLERYFMADAPSSASTAVDQDREVTGHSVEVRVFVDKGPEYPLTQGEINQRFFTELELTPQVESAIASAKLSDQKIWKLPEIATNPSPLKLKTADPDIAEDPGRVIAKITQEIKLAAAGQKLATFNSSELFVSLHHREVLTSRGFHTRTSQSKVYLEAAFSSYPKSDSSDSDEYLSTQWGVSLSDLSVADLFRETAERASHSGGLSAPPSGRYPVIIDADVLLLLMHDCLVQVSGSSQYMGLPHKTVGAEFIPNPVGDKLTLTLNPHLDFGADTTGFSDDGIPQVPLVLIDQNRVAQIRLDAQYASYLGAKSTVSRGDVVANAGTLAYADFKHAHPRVLEVLQFSGLFTDAFTGTFSSEIRLCRIFDSQTGQVTYHKGGSLSGNLYENFQNVRFSRETTKRVSFTEGQKGYCGPEYALLHDVSIVS